MSRVLIVEDHSSSVWATRHLISEAFPLLNVSVCGSAETTLATLDNAAASSTWHRVLLDLDVPGAKGLSLARELMKRGLGPITCVVTGKDSKEYADSVKEMGFLGYILKGLPWDEFRNVFDRIFAGERVFVSGTKERSSETVHLTRRQQEALSLVQRGYSGKELANALGCSTGTAKNHVDSAMRALGVKTRAQAVARAIQLGLIDLEAFDAT